MLFALSNMVSGSVSRLMFEEAGLFDFPMMQKLKVVVGGGVQRAPKCCDHNIMRAQSLLGNTE